MSFGQKRIGAKVFQRILLVALVAFNFLLIFKFFHREALSQGAILSTDHFQCADLIPMMKWSIAHHGFGQVHFSSSQFAERSAEVFAEKLDPERLLFLSDEVDSLKAALRNHWSQFVAKKDCSFLNSWVEESMPKSRKRLFERTRYLIQNDSFTLNAPTKTKKKNIAFAVNLEDLQKRQDEFLRILFFETPPLIRKAYRSNLSLFFEERLDTSVFPEDLEPLSLFAKALLGTLDPYSTYFSKKEFNDFYEELSGLNAGVGISVEKSPNSLGITEVLKKSPAEKAGIEEGDQIIAVDGKSLVGLNFRTCTQLLKGTEGSLLTLTLEHQNTRRQVQLKRSANVFKEKRVSSQKIQTLKNKSITVISIPSFYGRGGMEGLREGLSSSEDLKKELTEIGKVKNDAIILDLRGNPGGYLEEAVTMAGYFLGEKVVVGVKDHEQTKTMQPSGTAQLLYQGPLVVWVDEETASAAEVLAAALKDYQRAILVGTPTTFGKGSVQKLFQIDDPFLDLKLDRMSGVIKLTTSLFFSPLGHSPANGGVSTHIVLGPEKFEKGKESKVPEIKDVFPIVDETILSQLDNHEPLFLDKVAEIKVRNQGKANDLPHVLDIADQTAEVTIN